MVKDSSMWPKALEILSKPPFTKVEFKRVFNQVKNRPIHDFLVHATYRGDMEVTRSYVILVFKPLRVSFFQYSDTIAVFYSSMETAPLTPFMTPPQVFVM